MGDILSNASSSQLLILIGFVLVLAMLFMAVIVLSFVRRSKKSGTDPGSRSPLATTPAPSGGRTKSVTNIPAAPTSRSHEPALTNRLDLQDRTKSAKQRLEETNLVPSYSEGIDLASRLAVSTSQPASPLSSLAEEPDELLRFLHDPNTGQFVVEVGDQRYTKLTEVPDRKVGQYLLELAAHFLHFTNGVVVTEAGMKNVGLPKVGVTPKPMALATRRRAQATMPTSGNPFNSPASDDAERALLESLQSKLQAGSQRSRSGLFNLGVVAQPEATVSPLNLANQINEIVQARLRYVPLSRRPEVSISSSLSGGIRIKVDNKYYNTPDEVPDLEVRQLIKDSIKEWERS
jgi:hypothetical protein